MQFWENKKILVTGSTGFVGSNLTQRLKEHGAKVYGISRHTEGVNVLRTDILDFEKVNKFVKKNKINFCYHLAGEALVEKGQTDPYNTFKTNVDGTLNILEMARKNLFEKVIIASTSHVYGYNKPPFFEDFNPKPSRPYETSKTCTDLIAQSYADTFSLLVLIPRFVNIYGPGDLNFNRLIPKTIRSIIKGDSPSMWGGKARRDYLYIDDAVEAYIRLGELPAKLMEKNRIFNFGTGKVVSVEELMKLIMKISGKKLRIEKIADGRPDEISAQFVSSNKANKVLSWKPKYTLSQGLTLTFKWYQERIKL